MNGSKYLKDEPDFEIQMQQLSDVELKEILKKRKLYQDKAAKAAIQEAVKRNIISSEDDLFSAEFKHEPLKARLFPLIENPKIKTKIRKSISRGLLLSGILPLVAGLVRLNAGIKPEGIMLVAFGLIWMGLSAWLIKMYADIVVKILFLLIALSLIFVIRRVVLSPQVVFMNIFITVVIYSLAVYGLLFLQRLKT